MQTDTALVRSDRTVELYTVTGIYLNLTFIVNPWYTEFELSFRIDVYKRQMLVSAITELIPLMLLAIIWISIGWIPFLGLKVLKPQEALVLTLFGKYVGTLKRCV